MHRILAALLVASLTSPCLAAEDSKSNTLTPKEIAEGLILLFDGESAFGWDVASKPAVRKGVLIHDGTEHSLRASTTTLFRDYEVKLDYLVEKTAKATSSVSWAATAVARVERPIREEASVELPTRKEWRTATLGVKDSVMTFSEFGEKGDLAFGVRRRLINAAIPQTISFIIPEGNKLSLRNVKLKPLGTKPLLNVKDRSNWAEYGGDPKRAKSQFTVTKDGWLSIKNGPGDLQTTGQWADFVLQLECRTNGDNLNSGVFFRCIPGEYQNGYEAQIQNQKAKEPKKYTIQEYDPRTHELTDKKTIENWSQDYGTGAIYRRIPARRSVAKDREWFTMTVVAHGQHIATWVNGIQVVDWIDNRPENNNARNGCRLKKGPISLQGHDPTTDLNFRNIRLADLATKD